MLGTALSRILTNPIITDKHNLDVTNYAEVMSYKEFDFIVHLAAETDLEVCESNPAHCYLTNTIGALNVLELAQKYQKQIIFISTAGVFNGNKGAAYFPYEVPDPVNHYGRSKFYAEKYVSEYPYAYIIRAGWMMGGGKDLDKKFVNKLIKKIKAGEKSIKVVADCMGAPTYTEDFVKNIKKVIEGNFKPGIYHCTNKGIASRYDVAKKIVEILKKDVEIVPVLSDKVTGEFPCVRSKNEMLALSEGFEMPQWEESLERYLNANFND